MAYLMGGTCGDTHTLSQRQLPLRNLLYCTLIVGDVGETCYEEFSSLKPKGGYMGLKRKPPEGIVRHVASIGPNSRSTITNRKVSHKLMLAWGRHFLNDLEGEDFTDHSL